MVLLGVASETLVDHQREVDKGKLNAGGRANARNFTISKFTTAVVQESMPPPPLTPPSEHSNAAIFDNYSLKTK